MPSLYIDDGNGSAQQLHMPKKLRAVRLALLVSSILIGLILLIQVFWLSKIYRLEEKEFDHNVMGMIKGLYEDLSLQQDPSVHLNQLVSRPQLHSYIARVQELQPIDTIAHY